MQLSINMGPPSKAGFYVVYIRSVIKRNSTDRSFAIWNSDDKAWENPVSGLRAFPYEVIGWLGPLPATVAPPATTAPAVDLDDLL